MNKSHSSSSKAAKTERKIIEKNRRNQMKYLFSVLNSLIPKNPSMASLPLLSQVDEAISYIKHLEAKLIKSKQYLATKKSQFSNFGTRISSQAAPTIKHPKIEIKEMGFSLEIILVTGLENNFLFYEIVHILHEEHVDIVSASSSTAGDSVIHIVHSQLSEVGSSFGAARVTEKLKRFINGSISEMELELLEPESLDSNDLQPESWHFKHT